MTNLERLAREFAEKLFPIGDDEYECSHIRDYFYPHEHRNLCERVFLAGAAARQAEIDELVAALEFYADRNNWLRDEKGWRHDMIDKDLDDETLTIWDGRFSGKRAREALKKHGSEKDE